MTKPVNLNDLKSTKGIVVIALAVFTVLTWIFSSDLYGPNSVFKGELFGNEALTSAFRAIPSVIRTITILFLAWVANLLVQFLLDFFDKGSKARMTSIKLLKSLIKYVIFIAAIMFILSAWGVNTATLIASAGILSLIIGLGAQSLIADIIAGLFMVFENDFEVGDIVVIDGWRGTVIEIGIRTTKLEDTGGNIKIINNSKISTVINQTKKLSIARCYIGVEYGDSLPRIELVIRDNLDRVKERIPQIVNGPVYKGVDSLGDSSVNLLFMADCKEEDIFIVQRAMNREFKLIFDENNINVPFPQVVINEPPSFDGVKTTKAAEREARAFADEQSELGKAMESDQN